jgi:hypothetical protein
VRDLARDVQVPKASVDEDDLAPAREHQIRPTGQRVIVEAIPVTQAVHEPPDKELRSGVLALDPAHVLAALRCA